jgi:glycosyltransferase involved in cell wall biosynthesis
MHVAIVGTYPPTRCGIATFTSDVESALRLQRVDVTIVRVDTSDETDVEVGPYLDVDRCIKRDDVSTYQSAARFLNDVGCDIVLIQHEFGIYGGTAGDYLLHFISELNMPYAVTLHTVLPQFSESEAAVIAALTTGAVVVSVFTETAYRLLVEQDASCAGVLQVVPHGAPAELYKRIDGEAVRARLGLAEAGPVLSTFGLLSEGKGIELVIRALAKVAIEHPTVVYVVAGRTHPGVLRREGERYRDSLRALIEQLGLDDHVMFLDRFLDIEEVAGLLAVTDVFCTPYRGANQIVSGALTFALAAKCPVVSTPYQYARDVLTGGAGLLVDFDDDDGFASAIERLLVDGPPRRAAVRAASIASRTLSWPSVGRTMHSVLFDALRDTGDLTRLTVA